MDWTKRLPELSRNPRLARSLWLAVGVLISWLHLFVNTLIFASTDLGLDDAGTWGVARRSLGTLLTLPTEFHSQPPLYYYLLHFLLNVSSSPWFIGGMSWFFCWLLILFVLFYWHELSLLSRLGFCLLFIFSDMTQYLSRCVRPYGMAAFLTLVACVTFLRLARSPRVRNAVVYVLWATAMLYTMAFQIAVLLVHGVVMSGVIITSLVRQDRAEALRRSRIWLLTMVAVGVAYLPYVLLAYHYQFHPNPQETLSRVLQLVVFTGTLQEQLGFSPEMLLCLLALAVLGLVGELRRRNWLVLSWPLLLVVSIAFVVYFIVGRSPIGAQPKYMMPAFLAACVLCALGFEQLQPRVQRGFWPVIVVLLAWLAYEKYPAWKRLLHTGPEVGPLALLAKELRKYPGTKVVFNDIGYESQRHAYVTRDDPDIIYATMAGRGWAAGGDNHLTSEYVQTTIALHLADARCFFYIVWSLDGPYSKVFVPILETLGYQKIPTLPPTEDHPFVGYCSK